VTLIDGHLRRDVAPATEWPVLILDVTDEEADLLLTTLDPITALAEKNAEQLNELISDLTPSMDVEAFLHTLREDIPPELGEGHTDPDAVPEPPPEPITKPGDLWLLGDHRLMCGDSTRGKHVRKLMAGEQAGWMWTDPPYGVSYVGGTKDALTIQNDDGDNLAVMLAQAFKEADAALTESAALYVAHPSGALSVVFGNQFLVAGWHLHETLVWVKDSMVLGHSDYHYRHEPILYGWKGKRATWHGDRTQTSVLEVPRPKRSEQHPTMKPVELITRCLQNSSGPGELGYEPFCGSGSTIIAAQQLGRKCYAMEIDPVYCDVAVKRWEDFTGDKAVRDG
jgi:DNA modification methylase